MWGDTLYFIPIALTTSGDVIGENQSGDGEVWGEGIDWLEYKDPTPPERLSSPAGRFWPVRVKRLVSLFLEDLCQIKTDG